jgi:murein hydrolase activator
VLEGQPAAMVQAPANGTVIFAGEFRTYSKLIVLEAACELRFILAGVATLDVAGGQVVAAGQPIGALSATTNETSLPVLYVALHRSGNPIDPGPDISGP